MFRLTNCLKTDLTHAQSVSTAFQLVAVIFQLQSLQQFGGVSATHLDWTMVPYVRKSFKKHLKDGFEYIEQGDDMILSLLNTDEEIRFNYPGLKENYSKVYQYAIDMTEKEVYQAVEGMYHNLNTLQSRSGNQLPFTSKLRNMYRTRRSYGHQSTFRSLYKRNWEATQDIYFSMWNLSMYERCKQKAWRS